MDYFPGIQPKQTSMNCPECNQANSPEAKFCMECGGKLELLCNSCGTEYLEHAKFCMECGEQLDSALSSSSEPISITQTQNAERRQLTVMFCGIVDVTQRTNELGAENFRQLLFAYQGILEKVVTRYGGHIAQKMDNGWLVYFGYPQGLEDAPKAAVRCGMGMMEAFSHFNEQTEGETLQTRIGIHTGLVVVDYHLALGDTTNIASRIEHLATPNTVLISAATYQLVEGWVLGNSLGYQTLRGIADPMELFQITHSTNTNNRFQVAKNRGLSPLVGREEEMQMLKRFWQQAYSGQGNIVLLNGEAGLGKSRLVESFKKEIAVESDIWMIEVSCSAYHQNTIFYPIIELFERVVLRFEESDSVEKKLTILEGFILESGLPLEESTLLFSELLSLPLAENFSPLKMSAAEKKKKIRDVVLQTLILRAMLQPVILIIEDLHWVDPSTIEWIDLFVDQLTTYPIFALCTTRPEYQPNWLGRSHAYQLKLQRLTPSRIEEICNHHSQGKALPLEIIQQIKDKTNGIPLFVEEVTRMILNSKILVEKEDHFEINGTLPQLAIPSTLQDSLIARLDQLGTIKELAQMGSILGREFSFKLLKAVSGQTEPLLKNGLDKLIQAELLHQRGMVPEATFIFKHALIQDTAYGSLLKSRRQLLHDRVVSVLEKQFPQVIKNRPELLAHHLTEANKVEAAIEKWQTAGLLAMKRHSLGECVHHLKKALALLPQIHNDEYRITKELQLLKILTPSLQLSKGYANAEAGEIAGRWLEVAKSSGDIEYIYDALVSQFTYFTFSANYAKGENANQELLDLANKRTDPYFLAVAHFFNGIQKSLAGRNLESQQQFEAALKKYVPSQHLHRSYYGMGNLRSTTLTYYSTPLHLLGFPKQALKNAHEAKQLAIEVNELGSIYSSTAFLSRLYLERKEYDKLPALIQPTLKIAKDNGNTFIVGLLAYYLSLGYAHQGSVEAAFKAEVIINKLYHVYRSYRVAFLVFIADAFRKMNRVEEGLNIVNVAFKHIYESGEKLYQPELYRVKGALLLTNQSSDKEVETCFQKSITTAKEQDNKWHELLAAKSLAEFWMERGKSKEAFNLLNPLFEDFPEKDDLVDFKEIEQLLIQLS